MSKRLKINIEPVGCGFVCRATNGDLPFEGRVHESRAAAMIDLKTAYHLKDWALKTCGNSYVTIEVA